MEGQIWHPIIFCFNGGRASKGKDVQGAREFGPRDCDDIVGFLRSVLWLSVHQADAWHHSLFLGRRVAAVHFLSEPVAMGEETTKTSLFTIEQCHYLRQIWTSISHVLVFTGYAPDLFQELSIVSSTLESDHAYIDSIGKNLSELFADTSTARVNRFELSCFAAIISKAFSRNATSQQNIDTAKSVVDSW